MRRPWPTAPYQRPSHYRETVEAQKARIAREAEQESLRHADQTGRAILERLKVSRLNGNEFDAEMAESHFRGALKLDGVLDKYIDGVISIYLPRYIENAGGEQ